MVWSVCPDLKTYDEPSPDIVDVMVGTEAQIPVSKGGILVDGDVQGALQVAFYLCAEFGGAMTHVLAGIGLFAFL